MTRRSTIVTVAALAAVAGAAIGTAVLARRHRRTGPIRRTTRAGRNVELARIGLAVGSTYAGTAARKLFASAERRAELDEERQLRSAEQVAERLGNMKGALMKLGQMASYLDDGLPEPVRQALAALQADAPPMSADLAAEVVERELGRPPEQVFVEWDPVPIASASIGQVHRAVVVDPVTGEERAVAVKVQYPGVGDAIEADLANTDLLGTHPAPGLRRARPDRDGCRDQGAHRRGARLPARGDEPAPTSPTTTVTTRSSTCPTCCRPCRPGRC